MKSARVVQSHGPILILAVSCAEALPKVMSCLASGLRGNPVLLGAALSIRWMCEGLGSWHRGCQHSLQHANTPTHARMHANTHTCLSILATAQGMPTHQPACVLPAGLEKPGLKRTGTINVSFHVFHVLLCFFSACIRSTLMFV